MNKVFTKNGWEDYLYWQTEDRKTLEKSIYYWKIFPKTEMKELVSRKLSQAIWQVFGADASMTKIDRFIKLIKTTYMY